MRVLAIFFVVLAGCTTKVSETERNADFKTVIQQALTKSGLSRYLSPPLPGVFIFHYGELPIYNGAAVAKPSFNVLGPHKQLIQYSMNMAEEANNVVILVDRIIIDHDSAEVVLSIHQSRLFGSFKLVRGPHHTWVLIKEDVSQS